MKVDRAKVTAGIREWWGRAGSAWNRCEAELARGWAFTQRHPLPVWAIGIVVGLLAWPIVIAPPTAGLDASWISGLYMAVHDGRDFGTEIVFSYGPLGFLAWPALWYPELGALAFVYSSAVFLLLSCTLVWTMSRSLGKLAAAAIAFAFLALSPNLEQATLVLAVAWTLAVLQRERPAWLLRALPFGAGVLAAVECLVKLSLGPPILVIVLIGLVGMRASRRQWAYFAGSFLLTLIALWLLTGQSLGDLPDYFLNGEQVISGYNEALRINVSEGWEAVAAVLVGIALVIGSAVGCAYRDDRARWSGIGLVAVLAFVSYKYAVVRFEPNHVAIGLSTLWATWLVIPWTRPRLPLFLVGLVVIGFVAVHTFPGPGRFDAIKNVTTFGEQVETVVSPGKQDRLVDESRETMKATYDVDRRILRSIGDRTVQVDPYEIAVVWAYDLNWSPLPVFQNYTAYTSTLDELNAEAVEDPDGPQLILRSATRSFEERVPAWDPPDQNYATLCHFVPLRTTPNWQLLRRTRNRCGEPHFIAEAGGGPGTVVAVPQAKPGELVFMRIKGVRPSGLGKLRSALWRPGFVYAYLNEGTVKYRLVPGTTEGRMMASPGRGIDSKGAFVQIPSVVNIRLEGIGDVLYDFYRVKVRPLEPSRRSRTRPR